MQSRQGPVDGEHGRTAAETASNLADTPRRGARTRPDSVVLECAGATRTWSELWERSLRVANGLRATGVTPQSRVAYLGRNSLEFFEVLYGSSQIRAVPTGINWRLSAREVAAVLADTEARVVFLGADFLELWNSAAAMLQSNMTVVVTLLVCSLSVAGAVFLIVDLTNPYLGLIHISDAPMRDALVELGRT